MQIALITETFLPHVDGVVTRLRYTVEHLQHLGHQVLIIAPDGGLTEYKGATIYGVPSFTFPLYPELRLAPPQPVVGRALKAFQPDILHVVNPAALGVAGLYYARTLKIPLLASYHTHLPKYFHYYGYGLLEGLLWRLLRWGHNKAQLNLCTSTVMKKELEAHGIERVSVWQRGVDTDMFHPRLASHDMRWRLSEGHPESPLLLYVGRLGVEKEIERIKPVLEAIPQARLALVGDGPYRATLEQHFAGTPTNFVGYLSGESLAAAYASADAFIFPSRTETLGLVLLEAMAAGCPVVAARSGGVTDIVTNGVNGYLFEPHEDDGRGAVAATLRLLSNRAKRETLRQNARKEAERWSWAAATRQLEAYYRSIVRVPDVERVY